MDEIIFKCHPIYTDYESSRCGIVRHKRLRKNLGNITKLGYLRIRVYVNGKGKQYLSSRIIWECHNGLIPPGLVVDHINRDQLDNKIENLRVVTQQQNCLNSAPKVKLQQRRPVIGVMNVEERFFPSVYSAGKYYNITRPSIKCVADGITLAAYSKRFDCFVSFLYQ